MRYIHLSLVFVLSFSLNAICADLVDFREVVVQENVSSSFVREVVDLDKDGDKDIVSYSHYTSTIVWHENDGSENFVPHIVSENVETSEDFLSDPVVQVLLHAVDIDGDNDIDIISASNKNIISVHINDGSENFTRRDIFDFSTLTSPSVKITGFEVADFDGDDKVDFVISDFNRDKITWYKNDGKGNFGPHNISEGADGVKFLSVSDMDGDGDIDIVSLSQLDKSLRLYVNNGSGSFSVVTISSSIVEPDSLYVKDMDNDGDIDIVTSSYITSEVPGDGSSIRWHENIGGSFSSVHKIRGDLHTHYLKGDIADVDGDNLADVIPRVPLSVNNYFFKYFKNKGSDPFEEEDVYNVLDKVTGIIAADVDDDGKVDLVGSHLMSFFNWYRGDGNGSFSIKPIERVDLLSPKAVFAVDLDKDGDMDVVTGSVLENSLSWHENVGDYNFVNHKIFDYFNGINSVSALDIDKDGDIDILATSYNKDTIFLVKNKGDNTFTREVVSLSEDGVTSITSADLNNDGRSDLLFGAIDEVGWMPQRADGTFDLFANSVSYEVNHVSSVFPIDIDKDGDIDVVSCSRSDNIVYLHINNGNASSFTTEVVFDGSSVSNTKASRVFATDFDKDGDIDILASSSHPSPEHLSRNGGFYRWFENDKNNGNGFISHVIAETSVGFPNYISSFDVDGDNALDVLVGAKYDSSFSWYKGEGFDSFTKHDINMSKSSGNIEELFPVDIDDDEDIDILAVYRESNKISLYVNEPHESLTVSSVTLKESYNPSTKQVSFLVSFSKPLYDPSKELAVDDFELIEEGISGSKIVGVYYSGGSDYTVVAEVKEGKGSLALKVLPTSNIRELSGAPLSSGYVSEKFDVVVTYRSLYSFWNSFLEQVNILEIVNSSNVQKMIEIKVYDLNGNIITTDKQKIGPKSQRDFILNEISGFIKDSYGVVEVITDDSTSITGRISYYVPEGGVWLNGFDTSVTLSLRDSMKSNQFTMYNTFNPSGQPNLTENWLSIANLDSETKRFRIRYLNQSGQVVKDFMKKIKPLSRIDVGVRHGEGVAEVGLVMVNPEDLSAPYLANVVRYSRDIFDGSIKFSIVSPVREPDVSKKVSLPVGLGTKSIAEIVNIVGTKNLIKFKIYNQGGVLLKKGAVKVKPFSQVHIDVSSLFGAGMSSGLLVIEPEYKSILASTASYYYEGANLVTASYSPEFDLKAFQYSTDGAVIG